MKNPGTTVSASLCAIMFCLVIINGLSLMDKYILVNQILYKMYRGFNEDVQFLNRLPGYWRDVAMTVEPTFANWSLVDDVKWATVLPGRRGFVRIGPKGRSWVPSIYHQLHCVNGLRYSYTVARDGLLTDEKELAGKIGHDNHCFQFLRQSMLCKADATEVEVEWDLESMGDWRGDEEKTREWTKRVVEAGYGVTHRCKDWKALADFTTQNKIDWEGIPYLSDEDAGIDKATMLSLQY